MLVVGCAPLDEINFSFGDELPAVVTRMLVTYPHCILLLQEFSKEGRPNAKKILVVITDETSSSDLSNVTVEGRELEMENIRVIPVAVGNGADLNELQKTTPWLDDIIETDNDENPYKIAVKILQTGLKGE